MKNRNKSQNVPWQFYRSIVDAKTGDTSQIDSIDSKIHTAYDDYNSKFNSNDIESLIPISDISDNQKQELQSLYNSNRAKIIELKDELTHDSQGREMILCPSCLRDNISSLDHIMPKKQYPEYAVHPYNLIPCCVFCNSHKLSGILENGNRKVLNFYTDPIPNIQFLFAVVSTSDDKVSVTYYIKNPNNNIDSSLFTIIENHFVCLDLLNRYREVSGEILEELETEIQNIKENLPPEIIQRNIRRQAERLQTKFGINYWKAVLLKACIDTASVYNYLSR